MKRKTTPKPTPKPAARPTPKPLPRPKPAPLDLVRSPNFDAAMAQQNYDNFIAEQRARMKTELGGAPLTQSEIDKKYVDDGRGGRVLNVEDAAKLQLQFDALRANNQRMGGSRINDIDYIEGGPRYAPVNKGPQVGGGMGGKILTPIPEAPQGSQDDIQKFRNAALAGMGERMPTPIPEAPQGTGQQMQDYQNFLKQGMQNSNTMNQGAMNNFANMQPGMQATQTASRTTPNQTMPVAGMGMQQPKQTPPRKFSTLRNTPARFG